jgi:hypothetical protein
MVLFIVVSDAGCGAYAAAASGKFTDMANSVIQCNAGTANFEIEDEVVYSFGDLGKRLTFYWIPGETIAFRISRSAGN